MGLRTIAAYDCSPPAVEEPERGQGRVQSASQAGDFVHLSAGPDAEIAAPHRFIILKKKTQPVVIGELRSRVVWAGSQGKKANDIPIIVIRVYLCWIGRFRRQAFQRFLIACRTALADLGLYARNHDASIPEGTLVAQAHCLKLFLRRTGDGRLEYRVIWIGVPFPGQAFFRQPFGGGAQHLVELARINGLEQILGYAGMDRLTGICEVGILTEYDDFAVQLPILHLPEQPPAITDRHLHIGQHDINGPALQDLQGARTVFRFSCQFHAELPPANALNDPPPDPILIFYNQHLVHRFTFSRQ